MYGSVYQMIIFDAFLLTYNYTDTNAYKNYVLNIRIPNCHTSWCLEGADPLVSKKLIFKRIFVSF